MGGRFVCLSVFLGAIAQVCVNSFPNLAGGKKPKSPSRGPSREEDSIGSQKIPPALERLFRAFFTPRERPQKSAERLQEDEELAKRFSRLHLRHSMSLEHSFHVKNWLQRQVINGTEGERSSEIRSRGRLKESTWLCDYPGCGEATSKTSRRVLSSRPSPISFVSLFMD